MNLSRLLSVWLLLFAFAVPVCGLAADHELSEEESQQLSDQLKTYQKQLDEMLELVDKGKCKIGDTEPIAQKIAELYKKVGLPKPNPFRECLLKVMNSDYEYLLQNMKQVQQNYNFQHPDKPLPEDNLTDEEKVAIYAYTGSGYGGLNEALRKGGEKAEAAKPCMQKLNSALNKLPPYKGHLVRRGGTLPEDLLKQHVPGAVVNYPAYTSSSMTIGFGSNHMFVIYSNSGRDVAKYSMHPHEAEVLFMPNTKFKVIDRRQKPVGPGYGYQQVTEFVLVEAEK